MFKKALITCQAICVIKTTSTSSDYESYNQRNTQNNFNNHYERISIKSLGMTKIAMSLLVLIIKTIQTTLHSMR